MYIIMLITTLSSVVLTLALAQTQLPILDVFMVALK